jgi:hypothetical protein
MERNSGIVGLRNIERGGEKMSDGRHADIEVYSLIA